MLTNMSEIMSKKISVLDISIDNFTAKEAMREALVYMESDLVSVIELVTIESLMEPVSYTHLTLPTNREV